MVSIIVGLLGIIANYRALGKTGRSETVGDVFVAVLIIVLCTGILAFWFVFLLYKLFFKKNSDEGIEAEELPEDLVRAKVLSEAAEQARLAEIARIRAAADSIAALRVKSEKRRVSLPPLPAPLAALKGSSRWDQLLRAGKPDVGTVALAALAQVRASKRTAEGDPALPPLPSKALVRGQSSATMSARSPPTLKPQSTSPNILLPPLERKSPGAAGPGGAADLPARTRPAARQLDFGPPVLGPRMLPHLVPRRPPPGGSSIPHEGPSKPAAEGPLNARAEESPSKTADPAPFPKRKVPVPLPKSVSRMPSGMTLSPEELSEKVQEANKKIPVPLPPRKIETGHPTSSH